MNGPIALAGGLGRSIDAPALRRLSFAVAAALLVHAAVFSGARAGAAAAPAVTASQAPAMTVRAIPSTALLPPPSLSLAQVPSQASESPAEASPSIAAVPTSPASRIEPLASPAKVAPPTTIERPTAGADESTPSSAARPVPAAAVAGAKPEGADRMAALPAAPDYLSGATLDPGPQPIGDIEPDYPAAAKLQEGRVVIRVLISDEGRVDNVAVVRATPPGLFEAAALEAFGKARFTPARAAGVAVKSQITVELYFVPINRGSRISGRGY